MRSRYRLRCGAIDRLRRFRRRYSIVMGSSVRRVLHTGLESSLLYRFSLHYRITIWSPRLELIVILFAYHDAARVHLMSAYCINVLTAATYSEHLTLTVQVV